MLYDSIKKSGMAIGSGNAKKIYRGKGKCSKTPAAYPHKKYSEWTTLPGFELINLPGRLRVAPSYQQTCLLYL